MNYKLQIHFLNDVTMWRAHVPALINMVIIKSPFLHQCRLHSNDNGFKIVQKSFIKSSSNLQEAYHLGFTCQQLCFHILAVNLLYNKENWTLSKLLHYPTSMCWHVFIIVVIWSFSKIFTQLLFMTRVQRLVSIYAFFLLLTHL